MPKSKARKRGAVVPQPAKPTLNAAGNPLLGPIDPLRACGECNACCVIPAISEPSIRKAAGLPCRHLVAQGCGVYERRPNLCRDYQCLWKREALMPADARPDRLGVMFYFEAQTPPRFVTEHAFLIGRALIDDRRVFQTAAFTAAMDSLVAHHPNLPIWLSIGSEKTCVYPRPALQRVIERHGQDAALMPEALRWLEAYAPVANAVAGAASWFRDPRWRSRYAAPSPFQLNGPMRFP